MRSSQTAMEAARNKLRILGLTDEDIATFQEKGRINPETTIFAPIAGTVVQRKIGPGQYVNAGASDPVYVIGDLSTVWMTAFVRETDARQRRGRAGRDVQRAGAAGPSAVGAASTTSPPRSIRRRAGCWSAPPSTTRTAC